MYRIVQEALNNAAKHGGARRAQVEVAEDDSTVRVTVRDDGNGLRSGRPYRRIRACSGCGSGSSCCRERSRSSRRWGRARRSTPHSPPASAEATSAGRSRTGAVRRTARHATARLTAGTHVGEAAARAPNGLDKLTVRGVGHDEPDRSRSERLGGERLVQVHRRDHDLGAGETPSRRRSIRSALNPSGIRRSSTSTSGCSTATSRQGGLEVACLADDLQIVLALEQPPQAPSQTAMVVREHDAGPPGRTKWCDPRLGVGGACSDCRPGDGLRRPPKPAVHGRRSTDRSR